MLLVTIQDHALHATLSIMLIAKVSVRCVLINAMIVPQPINVDNVYLVLHRTPRVYAQPVKLTAITARILRIVRFVRLDTSLINLVNVRYVIKHVVHAP